jgi:hypothetical protein
VKVTPRQLNRATLGRLHRGVDVYIGWGISSSEQEEPNADRSVLRRLEELGSRYRSLNVCRLGNTHAKILITDDR